MDHHGLVNGILKRGLNEFCKDDMGPSLTGQRQLDSGRDARLHHALFQQHCRHGLCGVSAVDQSVKLPPLPPPAAAAAVPRD